MEQQSAVEWLIDKLSNYDQEMLFLYQKEIEQAKQIEKEQIILAWGYGKNHGWNTRENDYNKNPCFKEDSGEEYYEFQFNYKYGQLK